MPLVDGCGPTYPVVRSSKPIVVNQSGTRAPVEGEGAKGERAPSPSENNNQKI